MKKFLLFSVFLFLFFTAGFFPDTVFHFWGVFFNVTILWFFIFVSYWLKPHEIVYVGALIGLLQSFFAVQPVWFWLSFFIAVSFVIVAVQYAVSVSGRLTFFSFSFVSWAGVLLIRLVGIFFAWIRYPASYGKALDYIVSPFFGWEIGLSMALFFCIGASAYYTHRSKRMYYV